MLCKATAYAIGELGVCLLPTYRRPMINDLVHLKAPISSEVASIFNGETRILLVSRRAAREVLCAQDAPTSERRITPLAPPTPRTPRRPGTPGRGQ